MGTPDLPKEWRSTLPHVLVSEQDILQSILKNTILFDHPNIKISVKNKVSALSISRYALRLILYFSLEIFSFGLVIIFVMSSLFRIRSLIGLARLLPVETFQCSTPEGYVRR